MMFDQGFHCVGLWHTHPEPHPSPSREDRVLARDYANSANSQLSGIVFVIVGNLPHPNCFSIWVDDGTNLLVAHPASSAIKV
jgi:proteasome lid subunit RPN8/RPN11